jgi:hypothetical protein
LARFEQGRIEGVKSSAAHRFLDEGDIRVAWDNYLPPRRFLEKVWSFHGQVK